MQLGIVFYRRKVLPEAKGKEFSFFVLTWFHKFVYTKSLRQRCDPLQTVHHLFSYIFNIKVALVYPPDIRYLFEERGICRTAVYGLPALFACIALLADERSKQKLFQNPQGFLARPSVPHQPGWGSWLTGCVRIMRRMNVPTVEVLDRALDYLKSADLKANHRNI